MLFFNVTIWGIPSIFFLFNRLMKLKKILWKKIRRKKNWFQIHQWNLMSVVFVELLKVKLMPMSVYFLYTLHTSLWCDIDLNETNEIIVIVISNKLYLPVALLQDTVFYEIEKKSWVKNKDCNLKLKLNTGQTNNYLKISEKIRKLNLLNM